MRVLVVNGGSSSLKLALVESATGARLAEGRVERIGEDPAVPEHGAALRALLPGLLAAEPRVEAVGHRVVHGGARFTAPVVVDDAVEQAIEALAPLAPLHNPAALAGLRAARAQLPELPHVAVFDTAFFATLPPEASSYALPAELCARHGIRRYGFHGSSHEQVARAAARFLGSDLRDLRLITCHLGNGCSAAAVDGGRAVDTTMGMTPMEGLVMGSRSGDVDPGALLLLQRAEGLDAEGLDRLLNERSGLLGLSGVGRDLRDIEERAAAGDPRCRLAVQVFVHRLLRHLGGLAAVLGGVDGLCFTGGIGEHSALVRARTCRRLGFLGARLDEDRNRDARVDAQAPVCEISAPGSRLRLLVVASDEAQAIAERVARLLEDEAPVAARPRIPVAVSARHVHLDQASVEALFGPGHRLRVHKPLSQPGHFAAEETVTLVGPRRSLPGVRVLGPCRGRCQVEVARTDEFFLGVDAPIRLSGDLDGTPGIALEGPAGRLALSEGLICARRHIHASPAEARALGVKDRDVVEVALDTQGRDLVFGDVVVRISPDVHLELHLDTDEGNAAEIDPGLTAVLAPTGAFASLVRRHTRYDQGGGDA